MFRAMRDTIASWLFVGYSLNRICGEMRQLKRSEQQVIARLNKRIRKLERLNRALQRAIEQQQERMNAFTENAKQDLQEAKETQQEYSHRLDRVNKELQIEREVTIPSLVANVSRFQKMWQADEAIQVRRQMAHQTQED